MDSLGRKLRTPDCVVKLWCVAYSGRDSFQNHSFADDPRRNPSSIDRSQPLGVVGHDPVILDDRRHDDLTSNLGTTWRLVTDAVMGGRSSGRLVATRCDDRACLHLKGRVSLENNGGFLQGSLDLGLQGLLLDASGFQGVDLDVKGNDLIYNLHLRTTDTRIVWQSYRASFLAERTWEKVRLPFADFIPYRVAQPLNLAQLRRLGLVAIGREMQADLWISRLALY